MPELEEDDLDTTVKDLYQSPPYVRRRWLMQGSTPLPRFFYKYRHVPHDDSSAALGNWIGLERLITKNEIYYAAVDQFNDVHESVAHIVLNADLSTIRNGMIAMIMRVQNCSYEQAQVLLDPEFMADRGKLADHLEAVINKGLRKAGIFSMTPDAREPTMWGYYASESTGIAIQLAPQYGIQPLALAEKVRYVEQKPALDYMLETLYDRMGDRMLDLLSTKHDRWSHESEWRLLHRGAHCVETLPDKALSGIIFGPRSSPFSIEFVQDLLNKRSKQCLSSPKLWRATVNPARRRLVIRSFTE